MKKILFVNLLPINPLLGGIERITQLLTLELKKRGYDIMYLAFFHSDSVNEKDAPQYYFPHTDIYSKENVSFYNDFITQNQIDVIINQVGYLEFSYLFLNINVDNRKHVKIISVCHNKPLLDYRVLSKYSILPFPDEKLTVGKMGAIPIKIGLFPIWWWWRQQKKRKQLNRIYNFVLSHSDIFVVYTSGYISEIINILGKDIDKNKFAVIQNPNTYTVSQYSNRKRQKQILFVGRFDLRQKRPDLLLKIWRKLYKQYPDWELIFLGSGSKKMKNFLKEYVSKYHLERVTFKGTTDPLPYYQQASILALSSIYEGFPMVVTEAMANGVVPILFDSFDAAKEVVTPGNTGELVRPFDTNEFTQKLSKLMDNDDERKSMSVNAIEYVKKYDIQHIIEKWIQLF